MQEENHEEESDIHSFKRVEKELSLRKTTKIQIRSIMKVVCSVLSSTGDMPLLSNLCELASYLSVT